MRKVIGAAALLLLSMHSSASAGERDAFDDRIWRLPDAAWSVAWRLRDCHVAVAEAAAARDRISPREWMAADAATEAARQCRGVVLLAALVGTKQTSALNAMLRKIAVERALKVRSGEVRGVMCAMDWRGCHIDN
jgi:hypothetical protein